MLTDDEKSQVDIPPTDDDNLQIVGDWQDIRDLLDFAEKLKLRCDLFLDRIFLLNICQIFLSIFIVIFLMTVFKFFSTGIDLKFNNFIILLICLYNGLLLIFSEVSVRKLQWKLLTDRRALDSTIDLLRDNYISIGKNLSELQKIQFKTKLSRFDIKTPTSPWLKLNTSQYIDLGLFAVMLAPIALIYVIFNINFYTVSSIMIVIVTLFMQLNNKYKKTDKAKNKDC